MAQQGDLLPDDLVAKVGGKQWVPAKQIKGLTFAKQIDGLPELPPLPAQPQPPLASAASQPSAQASPNLRLIGFIIAGVASGVILLACMGVASIGLIGNRSEKAFATLPASDRPSNLTPPVSNDSQGKSRQWAEAKNNYIRAVRSATDASDQWTANYERGLRGRQMKPCYDDYVTKLRAVVAAADMCLDLPPAPEYQIECDIVRKESQGYRQVLSNLYRASEDQGNVK